MAASPAIADLTGYAEIKKGSETTGYRLNVTTRGYSGMINLAVQIDKNGVIKDIEILENNETPGFGTRINKGFLSQFKEKRAGEVELGKNIDAVTGATVSSRAITDAVRQAVNEFLSKLPRHQPELGNK